MPSANLLRLARDMQAVALAKENIRLAKKKKAGTKDIVKTGTTNIVATSLIRAQAQLGGLL